MDSNEVRKEKILNFINNGNIEVVSTDELNLVETDLQLFEKITSDWNFSFLLENCSRKREIIFFIFDSEGFLTEFKICKTKFKTFIDTVLYYYVDNLYHNSNHAVDVLVAGYNLYKKLNGNKKKKTLKDFSFLLALLLHDIGHLGYSSNYLIENNEKIKIKFGHGSVCEKIHFAIAFQILKNNKTSILESLTSEEQNYVLDLIEYIILSTDLKMHNNLLEEFIKKYFNNDNCSFLKPGSNPGKLDDFLMKSRNEKYRELEKIELALLAKIADLSNTTKSINIARACGSLVVGEMNREYKNMGKKMIDVKGPTFIINEIEFLRRIPLLLISYFCFVFDEVCFLKNLCLKNITLNEKELI